MSQEVFSKLHPFLVRSLLRSVLRHQPLIERQMFADSIPSSATLTVIFMRKSSLPSCAAVKELKTERSLRRRARCSARCVASSVLGLVRGSGPERPSNSARHREGRTLDCVVTQHELCRPAAPPSRHRPGAAAIMFVDKHRCRPAVPSVQRPALRGAAPLSNFLHVPFLSLLLSPLVLLLFPHFP